MATDTTFPLIGEPLAVDLVNTRPTTPTGAVDLIDSPTGLQAWLDAQGARLQFAPDRVTPAVHAAVVDLREHVSAALDRVQRGQAPSKTVLDAISSAHRAAPVWLQLSRDEAQVVATPKRDGSPTARLVGELADATISLLTDARIDRLRSCANPECTLLFVAEHPRRQWCSASLCGNRARVARYYQRHRGA